MLIFVFLLSILVFSAAMPGTILKRPGQVALQEKVDILVYGVLLFSESLHDLYNSTVQKLDRISHRIAIYEHGLKTLYHQTQNIQQGQNEIRGVLERLKAEGVQMRQDVQANQKLLQKFLSHHLDLAQQVMTLQQMLSAVEQQSSQDKKLGLATLKMKNHTVQGSDRMGETLQQNVQQPDREDCDDWCRKPLRCHCRRPWSPPPCYRAQPLGYPGGDWGSFAKQCFPFLNGLG